LKEQPISIRKATKKDIDRICAVEKASFTTPWSKEAFRKELSTNRFAHYYVLELGKEIVGYAGMWIILDEAHVTNVAIHPKYRGLKLGELLMRSLMANAKILGAKSMTLEVRVSNDVAQRLYRKLNFKEQGIRKKYYADTMEDALIMWVKLS